MSMRITLDDNIAYPLIEMEHYCCVKYCKETIPIPGMKVTSVDSELKENRGYEYRVEFKAFVIGGKYYVPLWEIEQFTPAQAAIVWGRKK